MVKRKARASPLAREAAGHVQLVEIQDGALGRAEPEERVALDGPREDAAAVGFAQEVGARLAADGDDALGRRVSRVGEAHQCHRPR